GHTVVETGNSGREAVRLFEAHQPDLLMTDIRMEALTGVDASKIILERYDDANILLITTFKDDEYISEALKVGCKGYLLKDNFSGIIPAVQAIEAANMVFDSNIVKSMSAASSTKNLDELSERERDILELVAEGMNNKEIACSL